MVAPGGSDVTLSVPDALLSWRKMSPSCGTLKTRGYDRNPANCAFIACLPTGSCSMQGALQVKAGLSSMVTFAPDGSVKNCTVLSEPGFTTTLGGLVETSRFDCGWSCAGAAGVVSGGFAVSDWVVSGLVAAGGLGG